MTEDKTAVYGLENACGYGRALAVWLIEKGFHVKDVNTALSYAQRKVCRCIKKVTVMMRKLHDRCVGFLMQVNPHIDDVFFSQMPSFLLFLSPSVTVNLPATSADKRYVPVYAQGYGHRKGE